MKTLIFPNPQLKEPSEEVVDFNDELKNFAKELLSFCKENNGLGMAAPQVGKQIRLVVINVDLLPEQTIWHGEKKIIYPSVLINPQITNEDGKSKYKEGCLSVPGVHAWVKRCNSFTVTYQTLDDKTKTFHVKDVSNNLFGTILLHEVDHLNGIEFIDKLEPFEKNKVIKAINKLRKKYKPK